MKVDTIIRKWQKTLRLTDWDIRYDPFMETDDDENHLAEIGYNAESPEARINVKRGYKVEEETIIHELLHLYFARMRPVVARIVDTYVKDIDTRALLKEQVWDEEEQIVNRITRLVKEV